MSLTLVASLALAVLLAVVALVREVRLRRALQRLLQTVLLRWRWNAPNNRVLPLLILDAGWLRGRQRVGRVGQRSQPPAERAKPGDGQAQSRSGRGIEAADQAEAEATTKRLTMEQQLQERRSDVEAEREELAQERKAESVLGPSLVAAASLAAVCLRWCSVGTCSMAAARWRAGGQRSIDRRAGANRGRGPAVPISAAVSQHHLEA